MYVARPLDFGGNKVGVEFVCANQPLLSYVLVGTCKSSSPWSPPSTFENATKMWLFGCILTIFLRTHPIHYYLESSDMQSHP